MALSVQDYVAKVRDSRWEKELVGQLHLVTEDERLSFLSDLAVVNPVVAMDIARRTLKENNSYMLLLEKSLDESNASTIRYWLQCIVPRLGVRRVSAYLQSQVGLKPEGVNQARYWMPMFSNLPGYDSKDLEAIGGQLERARKGPNHKRRSQDEPGDY